MLNINKVKINPPKKYTKRVKSTFEDPSKTSFLDSLEQNYHKNRDNLYSEINKMIENVTAYGDRLKENPTLEDFYSYRNSIKKVFEFLLLKMTELAKYQKKSILENKENYYNIVHKIDKELEDMFQILQKEQKENIALTDKVYQIKGLLVNFVIEN